MFDKLKGAAKSAADSVVDATKSAASSVADATKAVAESTTVEAQVDRVLNLMERAARQVALRESAHRFRINARINLGIGDMGIEIEYDPAKLREEPEEK